jgi:hypothetical protein
LFILFCPFVCFVFSFSFSLSLSALLSFREGNMLSGGSNAAGNGNGVASGSLGSLSRLQTLKDVVHQLTSNLPFDAHLSLPRARQLLKNEYLAELKDPLGLDAGNAQATIANVVASQGAASHLRRGKEIVVNYANARSLQLGHVTAQKQFFNQKIQEFQIKFVEGLLRKAWEGGNAPVGLLGMVSNSTVVNGVYQYDGMKKVLRCSAENFFEYWRWAHNALWVKSGVRRVELERMVGKRLEAWMGLEEAVLPDEIPGYDPEQTAPMVQAFQRDYATDLQAFRQDPKTANMAEYLTRELAKQYHQVTLEMGYDLVLIRKLHHLQRELKLHVVTELMRRRVDEDSNQLRPDYYEVVMEVTNMMLAVECYANPAKLEPNLVVNLLSAIASKESETRTYEKHMYEALEGFSEPGQELARELFHGCMTPQRAARRPPLMHLTKRNLHWKDAQDASTTAAKALLFFAYSTQLKEVEVRMLSEAINVLVHECFVDINHQPAQQANSARLSDPNVLDALKRSRHFPTMSLLLLAFMAALEPNDSIHLLGRERNAQGTFSSLTNGKGNGINFYSDQQLKDTEATDNPCWCNDRAEFPSLRKGYTTPMIGVARLAWYLYRRYHKTKHNNAIPPMDHETDFMKEKILKTRPFHFLRSMLETKGVANDPDRDVIVGIVYSFVDRYVRHLKDVFEHHGSDMGYLLPRADVRARELMQQNRSARQFRNDMSRSRNMGNGRFGAGGLDHRKTVDPSQYTDCLDDVLGLVESIVTLLPLQSRQMWPDAMYAPQSHHWTVFLETFLHKKIAHGTVEDSYKGLFEQYVNALACMCQDEQVAGRINRMMNTTVGGAMSGDQSLVTWSNIFNQIWALHVQMEEVENPRASNAYSTTAPSYSNSRLARGMARQQWTPEQKQQTKNMVFVSLKFMQRILKHYPIFDFMNNRTFGSAQLPLLGYMYKLLGHSLEPHLKGEVMRTLAVMVQHDFKRDNTIPMSKQVWAWMAGSGVIGAPAKVAAQRTGRGQSARYGGQYGYGQPQLQDQKAVGGLDAPRQLIIKTEFRDIEGANRAYPGTCGFLTLLAELLKWGPPSAASSAVGGGPGQRGGRRNMAPTQAAPSSVPNLEECLEFVWKDVFLNYKHLHPAQNKDHSKDKHTTCTWEITANCLAVFYRALVSYNVGEDEGRGPPNNTGVPRQTSPGAYLMRQFLYNGKNKLLQTLLEVLNTEALMRGSVEASGSGSAMEYESAVWAERTAMLGLSVLRVLLEKENQFLKKHLQYDEGLSSLSELLVRRPGNEFHGVACYVQYVGNAQIYVNAIRILQHVSRAVGKMVLAIAPRSGSRGPSHLAINPLTRSLINAFSFRLRSNSVSVQVLNARRRKKANFTCEGKLGDSRSWWSDGSEGWADDRMRGNAEVERDMYIYSHRQVLQLILGNLKNGCPSIAHVLLGLRPAIDNYSKASRSGQWVEMESSIQALSRTLGWTGDSCLLAIKEIVENYVRTGDRPDLAALCYRIFYELCKSPATSPFIVAHLRYNYYGSDDDSSTNGFWYFHAEKIMSDVRPYNVISKTAARKVEGLRAQKGNLSEADITSIEFSTKQELETAHGIFRWVLGGVALDLHLAMKAEPKEDAHAAILLTLMCGEKQSGPSAGTNMVRLLKNILYSGSLRGDDSGLNEPPQPPQDEKGALNSDFIYKLAETCCVRLEESFDSQEYVQINVPMLHRRLMAVVSQQAGAGGVRDAPTLVRKFLLWAIRWNRYTKRVYLRSAVIKSWGLILQVAVTDGYSALKLPGGACPKKGGRFSGTENPQAFVMKFMSTLLSHLENTAANGSVGITPMQPLASAILCLASRLSASSKEILLSNDQCHNILRTLMNVIVSLPLTSPSIRCTLVGALLLVCKYIQRIVPKSAWLAVNFAEGLKAPPLWEDSAVVEDQPYEQITEQSLLRWNSLLQGLSEVFSNTGDNLVEVLLRDMQGGMIGWRITALEMFAHMIQYDRAGRWISLIRNQGHLQSLLGVFQEIDATLGDTNVRSADTTPTLTLYEHTLSLMLAIAQSRTGAEALLQYNIVPMMASCVTLRRDLEYGLRAATLLPALRLIQALFTALPNGNQMLISQTLDFLRAGVIGQNSGPKWTIIQNILSFGNGTQKTILALREAAIVTHLVLSCAYCPFLFDDAKTGRLGVELLAEIYDKMVKLAYRFSFTPSFPAPAGQSASALKHWFHGFVPANETESRDSFDRNVKAPLIFVDRGLADGQWSRFDSQKWTTSRAILKHTSMFMNVAIRRIPGQSEQLCISSFATIVPIFSDHVGNRHMSLGLRSLGSRVVRSGLAEILENVSKEAVLAVDTLKSARLKLMDVPIGNVAGQSGRLGSQANSALFFKCQLAERHTSQIILIFQNILGQVYSHVAHYLQSIAATSSMDSNMLTMYKQYIREDVLGAEGVSRLENLSNSNQLDTRQKHPLSFEMRRFISVVCLRLRDEAGHKNAAMRLLE